MATKTFYVLNTAAFSPNFYGSLQDGGSAPTAGNCTFGWNPSTNTIPAFYRGRLGASGTALTHQTTTFVGVQTGPVVGTGNGNAGAGDCFVTPSAYTGTFAATAWTFNWNLRASIAGAVGFINMRVWKSVNADGSSSTEVTAGALACATVTLSTTVDVNSTLSWSPGAVALANQFLFFELEWKETTAGTTLNNNVLFRLGTALITTPDMPGAVFNPNPNVMGAWHYA